MPAEKRRPRVVLADDHPGVRVGFARLLQAFCELVGTASNGHEAIETVARVRPDMLVLDLRMPDLDGFEVCRRVKQAAPEISVIVVSAFDDAHVHTAALEAGASAFIPKHSAAGSLERTIQRIFAQGQGTE